MQRATVVFMLGLLLWMDGALLAWQLAGYDERRAMVAQPSASAGVAVFFAALLAHAWVRVRDVVVDHVPLPEDQ